MNKQNWRKVIRRISPRQKLHNLLGASFTTYGIHHLDWAVLNELAYGALLAFQLDDSEFNTWSLNTAIRSRQNEAPPKRRPISLVYVPVTPAAAKKKIPWQKARLLANFVIGPVKASLKKAS
jgi:hypothetical protein